MWISRSDLTSRETIAFTTFARLLFSLVVVSTVLTGIGFAVANTYNPLPDTRYYNLLLLSGTPEPKERAIFLVVIFTAPILSWLAWRASGVIAGWPSWMTRLFVFSSLVVIAAGEVFIVYRSTFLQLTASAILPEVYTKALATVTGIALALYVIVWPRQSALSHRKLSWLAVGFSISLGLVHAASRVHTLNTLKVPGWGASQFEAAFYSVSQVANGKTLLADLPAQYGLYAEMLKPVLSGASTVLRYTTTMAILQLLAYLAILLVGRVLIRSNLLFLLTGCALALLLGEMWLYGIDQPDPYYQYWPIRLIFPAMAIVVFNLFLSRPHQPMRLLGLLGCIAGAACIWNLDTGVPVCGATFAYLLSRVIVPPNGSSRRKALSLVVWTVTISVAIVALFFVYLRLKAGRPLELGLLFKYQKVFYTAGINLLPMPVSLHPWVLVGMIYLAGILTYIGYLQRGIVDKLSSMLFYLSILGIGLFAYYQGRSHEWVFTIVVWPAFLIGFALLDRVRRICAVRLLPRPCALAVAPIVVLGTLFGWSSLVNLPKVISSISQNRPGVSTPSGARFQDAISFIRKNTDRHRRSIILSSQQATYFGEAQLASAFDGPGWVEMVFRADRERFEREVLNAQDVPVFVDLDGSGHVDAAWRWILTKYVVVECSPLEVIGLAKPISTIPAASLGRDVGCVHAAN